VYSNKLVNNLHIMICKLYKLNNKLSCESHLSRSSCWTCRVSRAWHVKRVELVVLSVSNCAVWRAWHCQNAWAWHVRCLTRRMCRVETWRAKWNFRLYVSH